MYMEVMYILVVVYVVVIILYEVMYAVECMRQGK